MMDKATHAHQELTSLLPLMSISARLHAQRPYLRGAGQRLIDYLLDHRQDVVHMSVTAVAKATNVSEGSIIRLCQRIGARGFAEFKLAVARELGERIPGSNRDIHAGDSVVAVIEHIFRHTSQVLADTRAALDLAAMQQAITLILAADQIEFYGQGTTGPIAEYGYYRLLRIGLSCACVIEPYLQTMRATLAQPHVVIVAIIPDTYPQDLLDVLRLATRSGAKIIGIVNAGTASLPVHTDVVLTTATSDCCYRALDLTSQIAAFTLIDTLYTGVALARADHSLATLTYTANVITQR